jgi:hypothetical protein
VSVYVLHKYYARTNLRLCGEVAKQLKVRNGAPSVEDEFNGLNGEFYKGNDARQGLGEEMAKQFAAGGARLILSSRNAEKLEV